MFLSGLDGYWDFAVPAVVLVTGTLLNLLFTKRIPLIAAWLGAFVLQAVVRSVFFDQNLLSMLFPATGPMAFLFTFYMVSDPGTTPSAIKNQILFGAGVGLLYGVLTVFNVVYGLFWALAVVCTCRGLYHAFIAKADSGGHSGVATPVTPSAISSAA